MHTYLTDYLRELNDVLNTDDFQGRLAHWQFTHMSLMRDAVEAINRASNFPAGAPHALVPWHLPTTAVGRMDGLVIVSANPGFHPQRNDAEHKYRSGDPEGDPERNRHFLRHFFDVYPKACGGTSRYWTLALGLYKKAFISPIDRHQDLTGRSLWQAAHEEDWEIGGLDLLPFHSSRDKLTVLLERPDLQPLRNLATATFSKICSLPAGPSRGSHVPRRIIFVASASGNAFVHKVAAEGRLQRVPCDTGPTKWRFSVWETEQGHRVVATPYQVLSRLPTGCTIDGIARIVRNASGLPPR